MELLMHESDFLSSDVCVPIVRRYWTLSTLIFSSTAYAAASYTCYISFCLCFWWLLQYKAEDPPEVSQTILYVTQFPSPPITMLTIQQPLASDTMFVTLDHIFWGVPGVCGHCWKNLQPAENAFWHQCCVTPWTISKCSSSLLIQSKKPPPPTKKTLSDFQRFWQCIPASE